VALWENGDPQCLLTLLPCKYVHTSTGKGEGDWLLGAQCADGRYQQNKSYVDVGMRGCGLNSAGN
jgi:hypothetical protein